ncbi:MAG TPA: MurT ligase domain-containing protein [Acetobacteraceae bacterium]|nr:MurT ligase domain-containing protein [Acetobacteraceae bacterium]
MQKSIPRHDEAPAAAPARLLARPAGLLLRRALHLAGRAATSLPGRVSLRLDPGFLARARSHQRRIVVTGTNGKTSTVALIGYLLGQAGLRTVGNLGGANLPQGIATALLDKPADALVLEVDELTLARVIDAIAPDLVLVTGLFRDQMDRHGEVRSVRDRIADALDRAPDALRLLNGDDPLTASLAGGRTRFFRLEQPPLDVPADGTDCPVCGAALDYTSRIYAQLGEYHCAACGFAAPAADFAATATPEGFAFEGETLPPLPRALHPYSALGALAAMRALDLPVRVPEWPRPVPGRGDEVRVDGRDVVVVLGKNPASTSWNLARHAASTHLFLAADEIADGRDVSWFFDVTMTPVRHAFTAGPRARDMLVRLRYERHVESGAAYADAEDAFRAALAATPEGGRLALVATYTQLPAALALMRQPPRGKPGPAIAGFGPRVHPPRVDAPVRIALCLPDQLGTYGDSGNGRVLVERLAWRGIPAELHRILPGDPAPRDADILLLGGGEDRGQRRAMEALGGWRPDLAAMQEDGVPALLVCGGLQLYGESLTLEGQEVAGLGLLPLVTAPGDRRLVGHIRIACALTGTTLRGFENHGGHSRRLGGVAFGTVLSGNGNAADGREGEGIVVSRTIGTYLHGPVLARNPELADLMLGWVAERRGWSKLAPLDDSTEAAMRAR